MSSQPQQPKQEPMQKQKPMKDGYYWVMADEPYIVKVQQSSCGDYIEVEIMGNEETFSLEEFKEEFIGPLTPPNAPMLLTIKFDRQEMHFGKVIPPAEGCAGTGGINP